ncbi:hypothetical protein KTH_56470 [Thermosporothrix hazakensis]|nr:hypothetical protein KTH_56470 [Thermosporothrix hazakensis]
MYTRPSQSCRIAQLNRLMRAAWPDLVRLQEAYNGYEVHDSTAVPTRYSKRGRAG